MKFCSKCGKEIHSDAIVCIHCGCATESSKNRVYKYDAPSVGFWFLGFFIPIIGFVLYLVNKDTSPLKAKSAGIGALSGFIASAVFGFLCGFLIGILYIIA